MIRKYGELVLAISITIAMALIMIALMIMAATMIWDLQDTLWISRDLLITSVFIILFMCMGILVVMMIQWIVDWTKR